VCDVRRVFSFSLRASLSRRASPPPAIKPSLPCALFSSRLLPYRLVLVSSAAERAFIARYLFRPPLAAKSRGDRKRRHGNFVSAFSTTIKTSRQIGGYRILRKRERERERERGRERERKSGRSIICAGVIDIRRRKKLGRSTQRHLIACRWLMLKRYLAEFLLCDSRAYRPFVALWSKLSEGSAVARTDQFYLSCQFICR